MIFEIGKISRFYDVHRLTSYFGLVPAVQNSTGIMYYVKISKRKSLLVRYFLVEATIIYAAITRKQTNFSNV